MEQIQDIIYLWYNLVSASVWVTVHPRISTSKGGQRPKKSSTCLRPKVKLDTILQQQKIKVEVQSNLDADYDIFPGHVNEKCTGLNHYN
jgi:hypothetical protein